MWVGGGGVTLEVASKRLTLHEADCTFYSAYSQLEADVMLSSGGSSARDGNEFYYIVYVYCRNINMYMTRKCKE